MEKAQHVHAALLQKNRPSRLFLLLDSSAGTTSPLSCLAAARYARAGALPALFSVTGDPMLEARITSGLSGMIPRSGIERISRTSSTLSISPDRVIAREKQVLFDPFAIRGLFGLGIEQTDNAVRIANRRHLGIGDYDRDIGVTHSESCSAFNTRRAIAYHPIKFLPQLTCEAGRIERVSRRLSRIRA